VAADVRLRLESVNLTEVMTDNAGATECNPRLQLDGRYRRGLGVTVMTPGVKVLTAIHTY